MINSDLKNVPKFFSISRTIFSHSKSEQFWKQNTFFQFFSTFFQLFSSPAQCVSELPKKQFFLLTHFRFRQSNKGRRRMKVAITKFASQNIRFVMRILHYVRLQFSFMAGASMVFFIMALFGHKLCTYTYALLRDCT